MAIRIPRTTALFVTSLGRVLRENLGFSITEDEHWTFEHVAKWSKCGSKGRCVDHGISDKAYAEFVKQEGTGLGRIMIATTPISTPATRTR